MTDRWEIFDTWRSIWEAQALLDGHQPGTGLSGHIRTYGIHPEDGDAARRLHAEDAEQRCVDNGSACNKNCARAGNSDIDKE